MIKVKKTKELDTQFNELLNRHSNERDAAKSLTDDELQFVGDYDILQFHKKFPSLSYYFIENYDNEVQYYN